MYSELFLLKTTRGHILNRNIFYLRLPIRNFNFKFIFHIFQSFLPLHNPDTFPPMPLYPPTVPATILFHASCFHRWLSWVASMSDQHFVSQRGWDYNCTHFLRAVLAAKANFPLLTYINWCMSVEFAFFVVDCQIVAFKSLYDRFCWGVSSWPRVIPKTKITSM